MKRFRRSEIVIAAISIVIGGLVGWGIEELVGDVANSLVWLFVLATLVCLLTCLVVLLYLPASVRLGEGRFKEMAQLTEETKELLDDALRHQVEIISRESIYPVMAECLRHAKHQVAVFTYYMYDWDHDQRIFLPPEQVVTGKEDFYEAIYECIEKPEVQYIRIWQVPANHVDNAIDVIEQGDPFHKKEIDLIREKQVQKPDEAMLVVASQHTTASFILVDKRHLFFNIDFYDEDRGIWLSPYMIFVKNAGESAFAVLNSIIVRLTTRMLHQKAAPAPRSRSKGKA